MVATHFITPAQDSRWLAYLALSMMANLLIVSAINLRPSTSFAPEIPALKVSLMARAQPAKPQPANHKPQQQVAKAKPVPQPLPQRTIANDPMVRKVESTPRAKKKLSAPMPKAAEPLRESTVPSPERARPVMRKDEKPAQALAAMQPAAAQPLGERGKQASNIIQEARYRKQTPPIYPRRALELGQQGTVTLHAQVTEDGLPRALKVAASSGHRLLDMAALAAVKAWEFEPTTVNGQTVTRWVRVPVRFVIQ
jgi:protein TonB